MQHDPLRQCTEGVLQIKQADMEFTLERGKVYSCGKGTKKQATNARTEGAVMRSSSCTPECLLGAPVS